MSRRITVSLSRDISLPDGGLLGVGCALKFDGEPLQSQQVDMMESDIRCAVGVCQRIIDEELVRQRQAHAGACSIPDSNGAEAEQ